LGEVAPGRGGALGEFWVQLAKGSGDIGEKVRRPELRKHLSKGKKKKIGAKAGRGRKDKRSLRRRLKLKFRGKKKDHTLGSFLRRERAFQKRGVSEVGGEPFWDGLFEKDGCIPIPRHLSFFPWEKKSFEGGGGGGGTRGKVKEKKYRGERDGCHGKDRSPSREWLEGPILPRERDWEITQTGKIEKTTNGEIPRRRGRNFEGNLEKRAGN